MSKKRLTAEAVGKLVFGVVNLMNASRGTDLAVAQMTAASCLDRWMWLDGGRIQGTDPWWKESMSAHYAGQRGGNLIPLRCDGCLQRRLFPGNEAEKVEA